MKCVLYISGGIAHWVYFRCRKVVGGFEEPAAADDNFPYQPQCPAGFETTDVHLLVDCSRSEIDAYPLLTSGSAWGYRSNKSALQKKLIDQYPDAIIRSPDKKARLDTVFVQHINLPANVRDWLSYVECSGLTLCSVTCISELLAARLGCGKGCIVVSITAGLVRHTYCMSGHALFTRSVGYVDTKEFVEQFNQTMSHLRASELIVRSVSVRTIGVSEELMCRLRSLELIDELTPVVIANNSTPVWFAEQLLSSPNIRSNNRHRRVYYLLERYRQLKSRQTHIQLNAVLGVLVIASLVFTISNEWQRIREHEKYSARKVQLDLAINMYRAKAAELSPQAVALSDALFDKLTIESASGINPAILLTILAEAFSAYRALELQELEWVLVDSSAQSADTTSLVTKVSVSGRLSLNESLREQQNSFNEFIAHLEIQNVLSNLVVLKTPLDSPSQPTFQVQFNLTRVVGNEA